MQVRERGIRLDVLRPVAWAPESFSPAAFPHVVSTPHPAVAQRGGAHDRLDVPCAALTRTTGGY